MAENQDPSNEVVPLRGFEVFSYSVLGVSWCVSAPAPAGPIALETKAVVESIMFYPDEPVQAVVACKPGNGAPDDEILVVFVSAIEGVLQIAEQPMTRAEFEEQSDDGDEGDDETPAAALPGATTSAGPN